jgi:hypothetical protein
MACLHHHLRAQRRERLQVLQQHRHTTSRNDDGRVGWSQVSPLDGYTPNPAMGLAINGAKLTPGLMDLNFGQSLTVQGMKNVRNGNARWTNMASSDRSLSSSSIVGFVCNWGGR